MAHLTNLNFSGLDLSGLDFSRMTITSTDFSNTSLRKAKLKKKNLAKCHFRKAECVSLIWKMHPLADLRYAWRKLLRAKCKKASMSFASMVG